MLLACSKPVIDTDRETEIDTEIELIEIGREREMIEINKMMLHFYVIKYIRREDQRSTLKSIIFIWKLGILYIYIPNK